MYLVLDESRSNHVRAELEAAPTSRASRADQYVSYTIAAIAQEKTHSPLSCS